MLLFVTLTTLLGAGPVSFAEVGFSVTRAERGITVSEVSAGGVAAKAGLKVGDVIESIFSPSPTIGSTLMGFDDETLRNWVLPVWETPTVLNVRRGTATRMVQLVRPGQREGPEFPDLALPPEALAKLNFMQLQRYTMAQVRGVSARRAVETTHLLHRAHPAVWVADGGIVDGDEVEWTGAWVHLATHLEWHCAQSPMRAVLLRSPTAPVPAKPVESNDRALQGSSTAASVPLWSVRDVVAQCPASPDPKLPSVAVEAELRCEGQPAVKQPLEATLTVHCGRRSDYQYSLDALRLDGIETVVIGKGTRLEATIRWDSVKPRAVSARVVELSETTKDLAFRSAVLKPGTSDEKVTVSLDEKPARNVTLALQVTFPDGSTRLSPPEAMRFVTAEDDERDRKEFSEAFAKTDAVLKRLKDPCKDPDATVEFLKKQPEVSFASQTNGDISYQVGKRGMPMLIHCHPGH